MKTFKQVFVPIAVVVALVFGVTFLSSYSTSSRRGIETSPEQTSTTYLNEIPLRFGATVANRDPSYYYLKNFQNEYEIDQAGAFDFWFQNRNSVAATLRLHSLSCQCQSMEGAIVPVETSTRYLQQSAVSGWVNAIATGGPDLLAMTGLLAMTLSKKDMKFTDLKPEQDGIEVPGVEPGKGPQLGFVRLHWKGKAPLGPKRLVAQMMMQLPKANGRPFTLEANTIVLPSIRIWPTTLDFDELSTGSSRTREFVCVSNTRTADSVVLKITDPKAHPCITIGTPTPILGEDLTKLEASLGKQWSENMNLKSAWKVSVTVHERLQNQQLDLGPIDRFLNISTGDETDMTMPIRGIVRGDVRIAGGLEDKDLIDMGQGFPSERGRSKEVRLISDRPMIELELLKTETLPGYLEVTLSEPRKIDGGTEWKLQVRVPEKKLYGKLSPEAGVTLQTKDSPPRKIRIPVRGQTFDTSDGF